MSTFEEIYLKLITEADNDTNEIQNISNDSNDSNTSNSEQTTDKETPEKSNIDLSFSTELATEFSNTVNEFTTLAANMIKTRKVTKDNSDKCMELISKIKNLLDAAQIID